MSETLSASAQRVQGVLEGFGVALHVVEIPATTRTARDAAAAIGCTVEQIAKSLIFRGKESRKPLLVIASGANRVNEQKMAEYLGEPIEKADADFVRAVTGYAIGGVPPVGHAQAITTLIDEDLLQYVEIWAAAGNPNAVFKLMGADLVRITGGRVVAVK